MRIISQFKEVDDTTEVSHFLSYVTPHAPGSPAPSLAIFTSYELLFFGHPSNLGLAEGSFQVFFLHNLYIR